MPIAFTTVEKVGYQKWKFSWAATTSPYRIYADGVLVDTITDAEYEYEQTGFTNVQPNVQVLDANDTDPSDIVAYPWRISMQWRWVEEAESYQVDEYDSGTWKKRGVVREDDSGYYTFESPSLEDVTSSQWRVRAIDAYGNYSSALSFEFFIARNPDPPDVDLSYSNDTGNVTISER